MTIKEKVIKYLVRLTIDEKSEGMLQGFLTLYQ